MHGLAAAAVELVNLSAAAESAGLDHRARCPAWAPAAVTRCRTRRSRRIVGYVLGSPADLIEDSKAIQPGEAASFTLLQEQLHAVLGTPSERQAGLATMRSGLTGGQPRTLVEIGKVYGVTRKRIRQVEIWMASVVIGIEPKSAPIGGYRSSDGARENTARQANVMASVVLGPDPPLGLSSSCPQLSVRSRPGCPG